MMPATFLVNTTADSGAGSLRQAILDSNTGTPGPNTIDFSIGTTGTLQTIAPLSALPTITTPVLIDGWSQGGTGYTGAPLVTIDGTGAGSGANGLDFAAGSQGSTARGLVVGGFSLSGIVLQSGDNLIEGCYIGTNAGGTGALADTNDGVQITSSGNTIGGTAAGTGNVISGNSGGGVLLTGAGASGNLVAGNDIGTNQAGTASLDNGVFDVKVDTGASDNTIGGLTDDGSGNPAPGSAPGNVISSAGTAATLVYHVLLNGTNNAVLGNLIGTDKNGTVALSYNYGVGVEAIGAGNTIGGTSPRARNVISGNDDGIGIAGSGTTVLSDYIGPDITGKNRLGTHVYGLLIAGAANVTFGAPGAGNVLSDGANYGGLIYNATNLMIQGNFIGTDSTGAAPMPNYEYGLVLDGGNQNFTIGGATAGAGNVLSGNTGWTGLEIGSSDSGLVQGNFIGTDPTGMLAVPNAVGVGIQDSTNITVGGTTAAARNLVSGNAQYGLDIYGGTTSGIVVEGNDVGTKADGTDPLPNGLAGISLSSSARLVTIGGAAVGVGNLISGNTSAGISIDATGAPDGQLIWLKAEGNTNNSSPFGYLGAGSISGTVTYGPGVAGGQAFQFSRAAPGYVSVNLQSASFAESANDETVEGWINPASLPVPGQEYLLLGNGDPNNPNTAMLLTNSGGAVRLALRYLSTTGLQTVLSTPVALTTGTFSHVAVTTDGTNVRFYLNGALYDTEAIVGTPTFNSTPTLGPTYFFGGDSGAIPHTFDGEIDEIADYGRALRPDEIAHIYAAGGVDKGGSGVQAIAIQGNLIGTDQAGTAAVPNGGDGIKVFDSFDDTIGGTAAGAGNTISANTGNGVHISGPYATAVSLQGNRIGTDTTGTVALANGNGVVIDSGASGNTIGGTAASLGTGAGNVISGNTDDGVRLIGSGATGNVVTGNLIGSDASGKLALPNAVGVEILSGAAANTIGGTASGAGNLISGNASFGLYLSNATATDNVVLGNQIGTDESGAGALPNNIGVYIVGPGNTIGGTVAGAGNLISGKTSPETSVIEAPPPARPCPG
jgi:hypothetical protein